MFTLLYSRDFYKFTKSGFLLDFFLKKLFFKVVYFLFIYFNIYFTEKYLIENIFLKLLKIQHFIKNKVDYFSSNVGYSALHFIFITLILIFILVSIVLI